MDAHGLCYQVWIRSWVCACLRMGHRPATFPLGWRASPAGGLSDSSAVQSWAAGAPLAVTRRAQIALCKDMIIHYQQAVFRMLRNMGVAHMSGCSQCQLCCLALPQIYWSTEKRTAPRKFAEEPDQTSSCNMLFVVESACDTER